MAEALELWERPEAETVYLIAGWRQWADAGSISSALPQYLVQKTGARQIGTMSPDGFYLFQIPGTHGLVRPVVKFEDGYPAALEVRSNDLFFAEMGDGVAVAFFIGDEPHLDMDRYANNFLDAAEALNVERIVTLGGVYGELPYDRERTVSCIYSLPRLKEETADLAVTLSDYHGGASIGSYMVRRAAEREMELVGLYGFVPTYNFSGMAQMGNTIRIENDFMAWFGIMRRVNHMLGTRFDLTDLEEKGRRLIEVMDEKVEELEAASPELGIREYMAEIAENFEEVLFEPLDDVWQDEISRLLDDEDEDGAPVG
jgi:proteasome assembly chaperone (PAC2) family protein